MHVHSQTSKRKWSLCFLSSCFCTFFINTHILFAVLHANTYTYYLKSWVHNSQFTSSRWFHAIPLVVTPIERWWSRRLRTSKHVNNEGFETLIFLRCECPSLSGWVKKLQDWSGRVLGFPHWPLRYYVIRGVCCLHQTIFSCVLSVYLQVCHSTDCCSL